MAGVSVAGARWLLYHRTGGEEKDGRSTVKVTLWMAMSLNGMTARENQSEDFLSNADWELFLDLVRASHAIVWGSVTHELFEQPVRQEFPDLPVVAVTHDEQFATRPGSLAARSPGGALHLLDQLGLESVLLAGGSQLNAAFVRAGLIDHVVVAIEPVIVARGIPLVAGDAPDLRLRLVRVDQGHSPTLRLQYDVLRS